MKYLLHLEKFYTVTILLVGTITFLVDFTTRVLVIKIQVVRSTKKIVVPANKVSVVYFTNTNINRKSWINSPFFSG